MTDDEFRDGRARVDRASSRAASPTRRCSTGLLERMHYVGCLVRRRRGLRASSARRSTSSTRTAAAAAQPRLLPLDRAGVLPGHRRAAQGGRPPPPRATSTSAHRDREAVRHRPRVGARAPGRSSRRVFREQQVFRIDHYLGKETVQNVMAFRFANFMFEPVWNRNYIDHIQITAAEDIGIGSRAGYYDQRGRAARPRAEPHAAAADARRAWSRRRRSRPTRCATRRSRCCRRSRRRRPRRSREMTVRAQYTAGVVGRRGGRRATSRRTASRTTRAPRPTPRCASRSTTGAGRACRSSCAPASGSRAR